MSKEQYEMHYYEEARWRQYLEDEAYYERQEQLNEQYKQQKVVAVVRMSYADVVKKSKLVRHTIDN